MPLESVAEGTILDLKSEPAGRVTLHGQNITLRIGKGCIVNANIDVQAGARNTVIEIADGCTLEGVIRVVRGDGGLIRIGENTTFNRVGVSQHEAGEIVFGRNNMLSSDIHLDVSDMHPIYDRHTGERLNPARSITLEDDVWVGTRTLILKGAHIGQGAVIGAGSIVAGHIPPHTLAIGAPAKVVREDVTWRRDFDEAFVPEAEPSGPAPAPRRRAWADGLWRGGPGR